MFKKILKLLASSVLIAAGGVCIYIFRLQVPRHIVNLATVLGFAAGCVLIAAGLLLPLLIKWTKLLWQRKIGKVFLSAACICLLAGTAVCGITLGSIVHAQYNTADTQSTLLVLGCQVKPGGTPSLMLSRRINAAYDFLNEHPYAVAILCGGQGADEDISEAQCMYNILTDKGIAPERLLMEDNSATTQENITNAVEIMKKNHLSYEKVAVATSDFHQKRVAMICAREGITACAVNAATPGYLVPVYYAREVMAVAGDYVRYDMFADR